jgi:hypothetical protein
MRTTQGRVRLGSRAISHRVIEYCRCGDAQISALRDITKRRENYAR